MSTSIKDPLVFDIGRGSFVDGPGMRTIIFLKGCPLECLWCHNPESRHPHPQMRFDENKCIGCGQCNEGCNTGARKMVGRHYPVEKLARIILKDKHFYLSSNGGVTFSGGEPLLHIQYLYQTALILKEQGIHIAVETCGYFNFEALQKKLLPLIDLFLFDLKIMDPEKHKRYTRKSNEIILHNFQRLRETGAAILPRMPLIPGFTDSEENIAAVARFLRRHRMTQCVFLPFNPIGNDMYRQLDMDVPQDLPQKPLTLAQEKRCIAIFNHHIHSHIPQTTTDSCI